MRTAAPAGRLLPPSGGRRPIVGARVEAWTTWHPAPRPSRLRHRPRRPQPRPRPGCTYVDLIGGALDGQLLDVTGWSEDERAGGALLITEVGLYGEGGRADYVQRPGDPSRWDWNGDVP